MKKTAKQIKRRREALGLSIELAAGRAGISFSTWLRLESEANKSSPTMATITAIAKVVKCNPSDLV